jgi:hypothetical protein
MVMALYTLSDSNIDALVRCPHLVMRVIAPDDPDAWKYAEADARRQRGLLGFLGFRKKPQNSNEDLVLTEGEGEDTDLDKAWHGIHYLLTGTAEGGEHPLNFLVAGGQPVGEVEVGYGPARVLTSAETSEINRTLAKLSDDELRNRFDPVEMKELEIYPDIWDRDSQQDDTLGYLIEHLGVLRSFLAETARRKLGLVLALV